MTVSAGYAPNVSTGNGVTTVFPYNFRILAAADLEVSVDAVVKTLGVDYTVSGVGSGTGGNVTFTAAPANGAQVIRRRNMALTRTTDYQDNGDLLADVLNPDQDAPVMMAQQLQEQIDRSLKFPVGDTESGTLPSVALRAGKGLGFDGSGKTVVFDVDAVGIAAAVAQANTAAGTATTQAGIATTEAGIATTQAGTATTQAGLAATAKTAAETARDAAQAAQRIYASTAAGIAGTSNGQYFYVVSGTNTQSLLLYLNNAGTAVLQKTLVSADGAALMAATIASGLRRLAFNLFDLDAASSSTAIRSDTGAATGSFTGYTSTPFVPVQAGVDIKVYPASVSVISPFGMAWYDKDQAFISGVAGPFTNGQAFTPPAGAVYARFTLNDAQRNTFILLPSAMTVATYDEHKQARVYDVLKYGSAVAAGYRPAGLNLYHPRAASDGAVRSDDGTVSTGGGFATYTTTDYFSVQYGVDLKVYPASDSVGAPFGIAFYDKDKVYVSGISAPFTNGQTLPVPAGAAFGRIVFNKSQLHSFLLLPATVTPGHQNMHMAATVSDSRQWTGKVFMQLGDSISALSNWMLTVCDYFGATQSANNSLSGRPMANALQTPTGTALTSADFTSVDCVGLFLGTNDYTLNTPLGSISDSTSATTFYGYAKKAIATMLGWKPTLRIVVMTPLQRTDTTAPNGNGFVLSDYAAALRTVADFYGCPVLDLYKESGFTALTMSTYSADGLHPNTPGYANLVNVAKGLFTRIWPTS